MLPTARTDDIPPVSLSAISFSNLSNLHYIRFQHPPTQPQPQTQTPLHARAKYLEHGLGTSLALPFAAAAHLSDHLPAALPALIAHHPATPPSPKTQTTSQSNTSNQKHSSSQSHPRSQPQSQSQSQSQTHTSPSPSLWVFAPPSIIPQAQALLAPTFLPAETGIWAPTAPSTVTSALLAALRRAITEALRPHGLTVLGDQLVHPKLNLAYSFALSVPSKTKPSVIARVRLQNRFIRPLQDADSTAALAGQTVPVFAAPLAIQATLSKRPIAGDALSASVLGRWQEAGLLPQSSDLDDDTVVFLTIGDGLEVPFPRACVLTEQPSRPSMPPASSSSSSPPPKNAPPAAEHATPKTARQKLPARSRKRPRSPPSAPDPTVLKAEQKPVQQSLPTVPPELDPLAALQDRFTADAPTAKSLNQALELAKKAGKTEPVPVLHHPLVDAAPPPSFEAREETSEHHKVHSGSASETQNSPTAASKAAAIGGDSATTGNGISGGVPPSGDKHASADTAKPSLSKRSESSEGIGAFLLDGDSSGVQSGFDNGSGMDMTDFTAFDDDVAKFFGNSMDDRLPGADNSLSEPDLSGRSTQAGQVSGPRRAADQDAILSQSNSDGIKPVARDSHMDIDTDVQKPTSDTVTNSQRDSARESFSQNIMALTLSTLRKQGITTGRPDSKAMGSKLTGFFEDDLTERRLGRLRPIGAIGKRNTRSKLMTRRFVKSKSDAYSGRHPTSAVSSSVPLYGFPPQTISKACPSPKRQAVQDLYVPRRRMKAFLRRRLSGRPISRSSALVDSETDDTDSSELEEDVIPFVKSTVFLDTEKNMNGGGGSLLDEGGKPNERIQEEDGVLLIDSRDKPEFDPLKIAESVAVDCASACMVLATSRALPMSFSPVALDSKVSAEGNGSFCSSREEESTKSVGTHHGDMKPAHLPSTKTTNHVGSPIARSVLLTKRERDLLSLLTILEMQAISARELDIFREDQVSVMRDAFAMGSRLEPSPSEEAYPSVSSTTVRRVVHGLPNLLSTSRVFRSCSAAMKELNDNMPSMEIRGPLALSDALSEKSSLFPLGSPRVCVGYNNDWIETPSNVLPLWEKTGLEPYSERKNVQYVAVASKEMESDVRVFLRDLSAAYEECSFGRHSAMPFEAVTLVSNSMKNEQKCRPKNPDVLNEEDKALAEQFHLAVTGLCTKLAAVTREHRKNANGTTTNIVAYIVSPFENGDLAGNVALLRAVAPLVCSIPGTVPSTVSLLGPMPTGGALAAAPWKSSPAAKSVVSLTVRILPREVVDRQLSGHVQIQGLLEQSLRPQLLKAVSFAVFSSIRSKRVKSSHADGEMAGVLARAALMPDDLMSPMTPDIIAESPGGNSTGPVSPKGTANDDHGNSPTGGTSTMAAAFVDQSSALSPSFLHEPAVVLSGVGKHMGQTDGRADIVLHLAYSYCENSSRYIFAWTSQRGEMLDLATVAVSRVAIAASRRKAFWCMWARGQRWKISFVDSIHATVTKDGAFLDGEIDDWEWVLSKMIRADSTAANKQPGEEPYQKVVRRFPPAVEQSRSDDISDLYTDHPTPATPGNSQPGTSGATLKSTISLDTKMPGISSVTILNVCEGEETHFLADVHETAVGGERCGFVLVSDGRTSNGQDVLSNAILARFEENNVAAIQLNVFRHYGKERQGEDMADDRSPWDGGSMEAITSNIASNFHELRYVGVAPSWPLERWLSSYPIHLDIVRRFERQVRFAHALAFAPSVGGVK